MFRVTYNSRQHLCKITRRPMHTLVIFSLQLNLIIIVTFSRVDYQGPHSHRTKQHPRSADQEVL